jgi:putative SOS response-associated peptidase YedK
MPVILTGKDEVEIWLTADWNEAKALRRPLPDDGLMIVARDETTTTEQGRLFG